jgi:cyanophycin synthetase
MLTRYTNDINFDLYRNAADKLGIPFVPLLDEREPLGYFSLGKRRLFIQHNKLGINDIVSSAVSRNKHRTYGVLEKVGMPVPRAIVVRADDQEKAVLAAARNLRRPLVVKPRRGSLARGVSIRIDADAEIGRAVRQARRHHDDVLVEEFIDGTNYRVHVFDGEVIDVVERIPASVTGDGTRRIRRLIDDANRKRVSVGMKPIRIDADVKRLLREQGMTVATVPRAAQKIALRLVCTMRAGGETRRVALPGGVHADNLALFAAATLEVGLRQSGIDFITPDISVSYRKVRCAINEINRAPMLDLHYFADFALNNVVGETVLSMLQSDSGAGSKVSKLLVPHRPTRES